MIEAFTRHLGQFPEGADRDVVGAVLRGGVALPPDFELTFTRLLQAAAAQKPLLIVLDDVDSADRGSLELLRYLSRSTRKDPLLWIFLARQAPARFDAATDGDDELITLRLEPLADDDVAAMFEGLVPGVLSRAQRARLAYQADGNPEFAEEIALSLIDFGVVTQSSDGSYKLTGDPDAMEIPSSLPSSSKRAWIASRPMRESRCKTQRSSACDSASGCSAQSPPFPIRSSLPSPNSPPPSWSSLPATAMTGSGSSAAT